MVQLAGFIHDSAGVAITTATVNIYARNTVTPVVTSPAVSAAGYWQATGLAEGRYDAEIVNGTTYRRLKYDDEVQVERVETAVLQVRNPADTFVYDIVPAAITANRTLNLPLITATDTLAALALAQTFLTGVKTFNDNVLAIRNPADTFSYTIRSSAITANRDLNLPLTTGTDTLAVLGLAQTWTGVQTFGAITLGGTVSGGGQNVNNVRVGAVTPLAGTFTTLTANTVAYINETSNANVTTGLTINQGGADDTILALKSTDVAHGITTNLETNTYGRFLKIVDVSGGLGIHGATSASIGLILGSYYTTGVTTKSNAAAGAIRMDASKKSGTTIAAMGADENIVAFTNNGTTTHILDADGDSHQDIGTAWTNFDAEDDLVLLTSLAKHVARPGNEIGAEFARWATANRDALQKLKVVTFNEDGHHFLNNSKHAMLMNGAIRQLGLKLAETAERLAVAEARLAALPA